jgi:hypothetical protein
MPPRLDIGAEIRRIAETLVVQAAGAEVHARFDPLGDR